MNLIEKDLVDKTYSFLLDNKVVDGSSIIVGLSGGPDSTALLLILAEIRKILDISIIVAYVNHGMRNSTQLNQDDEFVFKLCKKLNVKLHTCEIPSGKILKISSMERRSSEEVARDFRYKFFDEISKKYDNSFIALGHNQDDQYETMITRFFQGSGINGLKGIPNVNKKIIRPLIHSRKQEIFSYLDDKQQKYRIDPTNKENSFLRNQVRNLLIPKVKQIFPGYASSLDSLQKKFSDMEEYFQNESDKIRFIYQGNILKVSLSDFNRSHKLVRLNLLYKMFDQTYSGGEKSFRVPERFFNPLLEPVLKDESTYAIAYGLKVYTKAGELCFRPTSNENSGFYYCLDKEEVLIPGKYIIRKVMGSDLYIQVFKDSPLIVRSRSEGDYIEVDNRKKSVKDLFAQWKVSESHKNIIPLIEDTDGISAILGELHGYKNIFRIKKNNFSQKFNILYLEVKNIFQE